MHRTLINRILKASILDGMNILIPMGDTKELIYPSCKSQKNHKKHTNLQNNTNDNFRIRKEYMERKTNIFVWRKNIRKYRCFKIFPKYLHNFLSHDQVNMIKGIFL